MVVIGCTPSLVLPNFEARLVPTSGGPTSYNPDAQVSPIFANEPDASEIAGNIGKRSESSNPGAPTIFYVEGHAERVAIDSCDLLDWLDFGELYTTAISCAVT